ncbi:MAG: tetratricopeptide repeat protein, partial [Anaerolineales bacterium]
EALAATTKTEDELLIAAAKRSLGTVEMRLGNFNRSEELLMDVLSTSEKFASDDYGIYSKGFAQYGLGELEFERGNIKEAKEWYQKALETWQDPARKDPVRHVSYALNGLGFVALKESRYEDAKRFFTAAIQSAEEFGRVDELAKGQLGLASVNFDSGTDLRAALALVNESIDSFQQQGMQFEIHKAKVLQEEILKTHPQILTSQ